MAEFKQLFHAILTTNTNQAEFNSSVTIATKVGTNGVKALSRMNLFGYVRQVIMYS